MAFAPTVFRPKTLLYHYVCVVRRTYTYGKIFFRSFPLFANGIIDADALAFGVWFQPRPAANVTGYGLVCWFLALRPILSSHDVPIQLSAVIHSITRRYPSTVGSSLFPTMYGACRYAVGGKDDRVAWLSQRKGQPSNQ